ncbi:MAG: glutathione S-transferase family protein [Proteobacteria bacterium]|nr:glutathione S-transferase family protein [Pseudomonadota bacterium]
MAISFYYSSGSPFAWRVYLALEHKGIDYELKNISLSAEEHLEPAYLAVNPRHKVPAIVDGDLNLYESPVILEYLEDKYPDAPALYPVDIKQKAIVRRIIHEVDSYLWPPAFDMAKQIFFKSDPNEWDQNAIDTGKQGVLEEFGIFEKMFTGNYLVGELSAADLTLYPFITFMQRLKIKNPDLIFDDAMGPNLTAWKKRIESLPYYDKTYPPHWKQK